MRSQPIHQAALQSQSNPTREGLASIYTPSTPQRSKFNDFSYTEDDFYGSSDIYYIINKRGFEHIDLKYVLALIFL